MNKNYVKGRAKEYRIKKKYEKEGYVCLRTAGSHGFADIVCFHPLTRKILCIQAKPDDYPAKAEQRLMDGHNWLNDEFICKFKVE